ncbi:MAG TPA: UDP-N-acetylmuramate dehydrogenase, partial [Flavisolibacter sp.]|nr:UDP-N-acetylmuramate dehydrogenase [Flavisolibacter sp.]
MNVKENIPLLDLNTFRIKVSSKSFASFRSTTELEMLLMHTASIKNKLVLGGGSNILLTKNYDGIVLKNDIKGISVESEDSDYIYVKAGSGENWHQFVLFCVDNNYAGVENLSLIPGNVGASPIQNIGAYGVEVKDVFHELECYDLEDETIRKFSLNDCAFGYRDSVFKNKFKGRFIITSVTFRLKKIPQFNISYGAIQQELDQMKIKELSIKAISQAVINIRNSKLPNPEEIGNAGSFFKNPTIGIGKFNNLKTEWPGMPSFPVDKQHIKIPAGWLVEQCGWKGYRKGDAGCYAKQALVLVNYGNATGEEILNLSEQIINSVYQKFNITLEREVNVIN